MQNNILARKGIDLFFNPEYAKLYKEIDGKSDTFWFECEYGIISYTFILREIDEKIDGITYYDMMTPYGYGGPLILEVNDVEKLMQAYNEALKEYCRINNIVCEFIRFHLFDNINFREHYYGDVLVRQGHVVVDTTYPHEDLWMKYEHKVRKNVKKALRNELTILKENTLDHLEDFLRIYYNTMERNNAQDYYFFSKKFFEEIALKLPNNFMFFYVMKNGLIISTELVLCSQYYVYSFLGGTDENYFSMRANDFLKDEIIKWCCETQKKTFVLGGGYQKEDGIYHYKRSFTSVPDVQFCNGFYVFNKEIYDSLVQKRIMENPKFDIQSTFFPLYRAQ